MQNKRGNKIVRGIILLLWISWMILIFWFSSKPADISTKESLTVGKFVCSIVVNGYESMAEVTKLQYAEMIDHFVRKTAHFCEYGMLGVLTFLVWKDKWRIWIIWIFGALYAATDEFHQLFVTGRYGSLTDVLLDSAGVLTGIALCLLFRRIYRYLWKKKRN